MPGGGGMSRFRFDSRINSRYVLKELSDTLFACNNESVPSSISYKSFKTLPMQNSYCDTKLLIVYTRLKLSEQTTYADNGPIT